MPCVVLLCENPATKVFRGDFAVYPICDRHADLLAPACTWLFDDEEVT